MRFNGIHLSLQPFHTPVMITNQVTLIGHLGADPMVRTTAAGQTYVTARIAFSSRYNDRNGNPVDETQWFNLIAWGQVAAQFAAEATRGSRISIEGRLTSSRYLDKNQVNRESVQVNIVRFDMLAKLGEVKAELLASSKISIEELEDVLPF